MGHKVKQSLVNSRIDFFYYAFRNVLLVSIPLLVVSGVVLPHLSFHSSATGSSSGTDNLTISISSACTLSSVVDSEHNASINAGTYKDNIGKTTIKTTCNDNNGYSIYANGYSNNEEGNNRLINTLSSSNAIETGLNTSGNISSWAMKLNNIPDDPSPTPPVIESAYDDTYGIIPSNWTKVLSLPSGSTDMSLGSSFTTTYAVYANSRQYTGTYQGQVKYVLTHPNINKPTLNSLELAFMSHSKQIAYQDERGSYFAMQDMTTDICNSVSEYGEATATQLVDTRDNKLYYVTKLVDGHCWMTQNLDFDIVADEQNPTKMKTLTSEDTDLTDHSLTGAYSQANGYNYDSTTGITSWTPVSTAKTINFEGTTVTGWNSSNTTPASANKTDDTGTGHVSLGNYYNWTAAIASNNSGNLTSDTINNIQNNPQNSICPKGWRLPTISSESETVAGSTNEFARLTIFYSNNSSNWLNPPLYYTQNGPSANSITGNYSAYWSSSHVNETSAYNMLLLNTVNTRDSSRKQYGWPMRCLAR